MREKVMAYDMIYLCKTSLTAQHTKECLVNIEEDLAEIKLFIFALLWVILPVPHLLGELATLLALVLKVAWKYELKL